MHYNKIEKGHATHDLLHIYEQSRLGTQVCDGDKTCIE